MQPSRKISLEAVKSKIITADESIITALLRSLGKKKLMNGDIVVISSKVVAVTQGRVVEIKSDEDFMNQIKKEADEVIVNSSISQNSPLSVILTKKNNLFIPWAGIDRSNVPQGYAVLWPKAPFLEAHKLHQAIKKKFKIRKVGIVIADSACAPLRKGVQAVAIGYAGFKGVNDLRGSKDLCGNPLKITQQAMADNLASAAALVMGEGADACPFVIIKGASVQFTDATIKPSEVIMKAKDCIFSPLYQ